MRKPKRSVVVTLDLEVMMEPDGGFPLPSAKIVCASLCIANYSDGKIVGTPRVELLYQGRFLKPEQVQSMVDDTGACVDISFLECPNADSVAMCVVDRVLYAEPDFVIAHNGYSSDFSWLASSCAKGRHIDAFERINLGATGTGVTMIVLCNASCSTTKAEFNERIRAFRCSTQLFPGHNATGVCALSSDDTYAMGRYTALYYGDRVVDGGDLSKFRLIVACMGFRVVEQLDLC
jgi:hypothetical protein